MAGRSAMSRKAVCCRFGTEVSRWNSSQSPPSSCPSPQGEKGRRHNRCSIVLSPLGQRDRVRDGKNDEATTANLFFAAVALALAAHFLFPLAAIIPFGWRLAGADEVCGGGLSRKSFALAPPRSLLIPTGLMCGLPLILSFSRKGRRDACAIVAACSLSPCGRGLG